MKAKIKSSGRIIEVEKAMIRYAECAVTNIDGFPAQNFYADNELEIIPDTTEQVTIDGWVARDANGDVNIFDSRPHIGVGDFWMNDGCYYLMRDLQYEVSDILPSLTYENSPKKVRITITPIEE